MLIENLSVKKNSLALKSEHTIERVKKKYTCLQKKKKSLTKKSLQDVNDDDNILLDKFLTIKCKALTYWSIGGEKHAPTPNATFFACSNYSIDRYDFGASCNWVI